MDRSRRPMVGAGTTRRGSVWSAGSSGNRRFPAAPPPASSLAHLWKPFLGKLSFPHSENLWKSPGTEGKLEVRLCSVFTVSVSPGCCSLWSPDDSRMCVYWNTFCAAVTEHHRPGGLSTKEMDCSPFWGLGSPRSGCWQIHW